MAQPAEEAANLIPEKCSYINMLGDKYNALNHMVETVAFGGEVADAAAHLVIREHEEAPKQCECSNNKDEVAHGV